MVTVLSEEMLQKLQKIAACHDCSLEDALHIAIEQASQRQYDDVSGSERRGVPISKDLRRMLDESA